MWKTGLSIFIMTLFGFNLSQKLRFSFMSIHDGYIYPEWKTKEGLLGTFYEDAVVVRSKAIALGDGLGGTEGYSGLFSHYHCLQLSNFLQNLASDVASGENLKNEVLNSIEESNLKISLSKDHIDVATTLVYLYLQDDKLFTGVAGDSGYSIFRFDSNQNKLLLHFRSEEIISDYGTPECLHSQGVTKLKATTHDVKEGDILLVASNGALDVLPYSFLVVAVNQLVFNMVVKKKYGKGINENSYDLADLLESFIDNLHRVSIKYHNDLMKSARANLKAIYLEKEEDNLSIHEKAWRLMTFSSEITNPKYQIELQKLVDLQPFQSPNVFQINSLLLDLYKNEICNDFSPFLRNSENKSLILNKQCFEKSTESKVTEHDASGNFNCSSLEELTFPFTPQKKAHSFKNCVLKNIPVLPKDTDVNMIVESFNSRYFSRNLGLAAKFMSSDPRMKIDNFSMKFIEKFKNQYQNRNIHRVKKELLEKLTWQAIIDDIAIASAVLVDESKHSDKSMTSEQEEKNTIESAKHSELVRVLLKNLSNNVNTASTAKIKI